MQSHTSRLEVDPEDIWGPTGGQHRWNPWDERTSTPARVGPPTPAPRRSYIAVVTRNAEHPSPPPVAEQRDQPPPQQPPAVQLLLMAAAPAACANIPPFWEDMPHHWFEVFEGVCGVNGIIDPMLRYYQLVSALPVSVTRQLEGVYA